MNPLSKLMGRLKKDAFGKQDGTKVIRKQEEAEVGTGTKNGQKHGLSYTKSHKDYVEQIMRKTRKMLECSHRERTDPAMREGKTGGDRSPERRET